MMATSGVILLALLTCGDELPASVSEAKLDQHGLRVHVVESACQRGPTKIRVLLPDRLEPEQRYRVVYVLPVEAGDESQFGDDLLEVKRCDLHNKYRAAFVAPTFSHLPWYADHPTDPRMRQETYLLKVVVPFVEQQYGMGDIFGTQENFEKYQITELLEQRAVEFRRDTRLILTGHGAFREHHRQVHDLMMQTHEHEHEDYRQDCVVFLLSTYACLGRSVRMLS